MDLFNVLKFSLPRVNIVLLAIKKRKKEKKQVVVIKNDFIFTTSMGAVKEGG